MNTTINWRERCVAATIHFAATAAVAALAAALIFGVWFPGALADMVGGRKLFFLVVGIDLVLGPLISLVIYNSQKSRGKLLLDYTVVGALQLGALIYGVSVIAVSRPLFIVYAVDRLEVVASIELSDKDLAAASDPRYRQRPLFGPRLVAAQLPHDAGQSNALLFSAAAGKDIQMFPQYYRPYETARAQILQHSDSLASLQQKNAVAAQKIKAAIAAAQLHENAVRILPVHSRFGFWAVLIDAKNGKPIKYVPVDPDAL